MMPAIDAERIDGVIEHRRRAEPDAHHVDAAGREPVDQRRLELGRAQPAVAADGDAAAAGIAQHDAAKLRPIARGVGRRAASRRRCRGCRIRAGWSGRSGGPATRRQRIGHLVSVGQQYSARMARTASRMSGRASAKAMLAWRKPTLSPQSKRRALEAQAHERPAVAADQPRQRVGELDLAAGAALRAREMVEDFGLQDVAADDAERRGRVAGIGLLDHALHLHEAAVIVGSTSRMP